MTKNKCGPSLLLSGVLFSCILLFSCGKNVADALPELLETDGKGLVKGTLKNVASRLQEEDNPVLEVLTLKTKKR